MQHMLQDGSKPLPLYFYLSMKCERRVILKKIFSSMYKIAGEESSALRVALGEAIINALRHGIGVRVKINLIGNRLVLRVKDDGPGFAGNALVARYSVEDKEKMFKTGIYEEQGRGIKLMMIWTDQIRYNKKGNEVLLVKQLAVGKSCNPKY